jgi:hypothetical protein
MTKASKFFPAMSDRTWKVCKVLLWLLITWVFMLLVRDCGALMVPAVSGGSQGPWNLRANLAINVQSFSIGLVLSAMPMVLLWNLLEMIWDKSIKDIWATKKNEVISTIMFVFFFASIPFFLVVGEAHRVHVSNAGIQRDFWHQTTLHRFSDISELHTIPAGMHSKSLEQYGPWYRVNFTDGTQLEFGLAQNYGGLVCADFEHQNIADFAARQSGKSWAKWSDAHVKKKTFLEFLWRGLPLAP